MVTLNREMQGIKIMKNEQLYKLLEGESNGDYGSRCEFSVVGYVNVSDFDAEDWKKNVPNGFVQRKYVKVEKVAVEGIPNAWNYEEELIEDEFFFDDAYNVEEWNIVE
tara:strand:+ start:165 stop:488 length:324 start_codon:yes stop_codon:yes gene_type:complete